MKRATENFQISKEYEKEMENIKKEIEKGNCSSFKECNLLLGDSLPPDLPLNLSISNKARKKLEKLVNKNPEQHLHVIKKINQINEKPEHYKPLSGGFQGLRRVHIEDFVLIYHLEGNEITILDYDHHKRIYA
ncbi:type II toxin-antitoxin system RelE family toxin [Methanobacterium sp.]|uniref:type II toxin-antitoxin system RelE family toxin n=1 Tax=Methanobacterium sp. TaxID=2164 RepID=UPI003C75FD38